MRAMRSKLLGRRVNFSDTSNPADIITLVTSWSWRSWDMQLQMDRACPYINIDMLIGIDDTDSPAGMCTTYLGAVLARRLIHEHMRVREARLVRLNPNVTFKTRGTQRSRSMWKETRSRGSRLRAPSWRSLPISPARRPIPGWSWQKSVPTRPFTAGGDGLLRDRRGRCLLEAAGARYRGWKNRRGLIGATAAVSSIFPDTTYEILAYRDPSRWGTPREVDRESLFAAEEATFPHTWDTVDPANRVVVCVPHTPDPSSLVSGARARPG